MPKRANSEYIDRATRPTKTGTKDQFTYIPKFTGWGILLDHTFKFGEGQQTPHHFNIRRNYRLYTWLGVVQVTREELNC